MKRPIRTHYLYNEPRVKTIVFLKRKGWGYQDIADGFLNEFNVKTTRQNIRYLYKKYYRKFSKVELDSWVIPDNI